MSIVEWIWHAQKNMQRMQRRMFTVKLNLHDPASTILTVLLNWPLDPIDTAALALAWLTPSNQLPLMVPYLSDA